MPKVIKSGKVVIIIAGRYAGKKAVVVKTFDDGTRDRHFGHALVAGIDEAPLKVTKSMSKKKILKRSRVKPFVKLVNYTHLMPTRYSVDVDVRSVVDKDALETSSKRIETRKNLKKVFENRYLNRGKNSQGLEFLYEKLRF